MSESHASFTGSIPAIYDACLGPLLFEFSARDLARRVAGGISGGPVLEIACGTGISTSELRAHLDPAISIVATDVNPGMLDFARERRGDLAGVRYEVADACGLPFEDESFEAVVCQFGIMFFPDLPAGLAELARELEEAFGPAPLRIPLREFVLEGRAPSRRSGSTAPHNPPSAE